MKNKLWLVVVLLMISLTIGGCNLFGEEEDNNGAPESTETVPGDSNLEESSGDEGNSSTGGSSFPSPGAAGGRGPSNSYVTIN